MVLVRTIEKNDEPVVAEIIRTVLEESHLDVPGTAYFDPQLDYMFDHYQSQVTSEYWVIEEEGNIVGGVGIGLLAISILGLGKVGEIQKLYLLPETRGIGYSRRLMETLMAFSMSQGYDYLYLKTIHTLKAAIKLYEKLDFERLDAPIDGESHHPLMDVFMGKKLN